MININNMIFLFDIDGTLTVPRGKITTEMLTFLCELRKNHTICTVGGSDFEKAKEQIGEDMLERFDYIFPENGLVFYKHGELVHKKSLTDYVSQEELDQFISFCLDYIDKLDIPVKTSNFVEVRTGIINVSPIGRSCSREQRDAYEIYDKENHIRENLINTLKERFSNIGFQYSVGGQISFDVFPNGLNKTFCLEYLPKDTTIHFFGDKTHLGGNDYEIFNDSRVIGHTVTSPEDTYCQIKKIL